MLVSHSSCWYIVQNVEVFFAVWRSGVGEESGVGGRPCVALNISIRLMQCELLMWMGCEDEEMNVVTKVFFSVRISCP